MELLNHQFFKHAKRHRASFRDLFHPIKPLTTPSNPGMAHKSAVLYNIQIWIFLGSSRESVERRSSLPTSGAAASSSACDASDLENIEWQF